MKKINSFYLSLLAGALFTLGACSKNDDVTPIEPIPEHLGIYVLNEGNFQSTNASLGLYNFRADNYETKESNIGDTGNDIGRYGSKLYVILTGSTPTGGKVLVYNAKSAEKIGEIPVASPRYIQFYKGKAYLTHGENQLSQIDTGSTVTSLPTVAKSIQVGRTPEQLTVFKDKIYVANSGAFSDTYDNVVSVVNVGSFTLDRNIEVAENITSVHADTINNTLYVNASAIYDAAGQITSPSKLYAVNTSTDAKTPFTFGAEQMFIFGKAAVLISSNKTEGKYNILFTNDIQSQQFNDNAIVNTELVQPYGITFIPSQGIIAIADAKDFQSNGEVFLYNSSFQQFGKISAGRIPKKVAFKD